VFAVVVAAGVARCWRSLTTTAQAGTNRELIIFFGGLRPQKGSLQLLIEQLILVQILEIEEESGTSLTGTNQHGFKKECSTITASLTFSQELLLSWIRTNMYWWQA
jgi:hypothetical protein